MHDSLPTSPLSAASQPAAADPRQVLLLDWLDTLPAFDIDRHSIRPASADASFRRYFRLSTGNGATLIAMDAPPMHEDVRPFVRIAALFSACGVQVPQILAEDAERGFLLLNDFGDTTFLQALNDDSADQLYHRALDTLVTLQSGSIPGELPEYDRATLLRELHLFPDWYLTRHLNITLDTQQTQTLHTVFDVIVANNLAQPQVYVHRDYHSRNLMLLPDGSPGVLDFQDALYGPITYDLVSLLLDAYVDWSEERVLDWTIRYWEAARRAGLPMRPDIDSFYRDVEFMGIQRHLKVIGIFARLCHRDGKPAYLDHLPRLLNYIRRPARRYRELAPLYRLLDQLHGPSTSVGYTF